MLIIYQPQPINKVLTKGSVNDSIGIRNILLSQALLTEFVHHIHGEHYDD